MCVCVRACLYVCVDIYRHRHTLIAQAWKDKGIDGDAHEHTCVLIFKCVLNNMLGPLIVSLKQKKYETKESKC